MVADAVSRGRCAPISQAESYPPRAHAFEPPRRITRQRMIVVAWDEKAEETAGRLVNGVVVKNRELFKHYHDIGIQDMISDVLMDLRREFPSYNPKYAFSTWVTMVAKCRLIDRCRRRARVAEREAVYAGGKQFANDGTSRIGDQGTRRVPVYEADEVLDPEPAEPETVDGEAVGGDGEQTLSEWLHTVHVYARRLTQSPEHRARRTYDAAQVLTIKALQRKMNLTVRGMRGLFEDRQDLCNVVGFDRAELPSVMWFCRAMNPDGTGNLRAG